MSWDTVVRNYLLESLEELTNQRETELMLN